MTTRRFVVHGVVQGVGFRWFVSRAAEKLGVCGEVWNRADGDVEVVAQHPDGERVAVLERALWTGPGRVLSVQGYEVAQAAVYEGFQIGSAQSANT